MVGLAALIHRSCYALAIVPFDFIVLGDGKGCKQ